MTTQDIIKALALTGNRIKQRLDSGKYEEVFARAIAENGWFTEESVRKAMDAVVTEFLSEEKLKAWVTLYPALAKPIPKKIAIVMAGNIPMVGLHDLLCVLMAGHIAHIKLSSKDTVLMKLFVDELGAISPELKNHIVIVERLSGFDAVIATGSNNSARYFEYYFGKYPSVIRRSRSSVAILTGKESQEDFFNLAKDIFSYFGLGCRNVCKLFVPQGYDFNPLFHTLESYHDIIHFNKYHNNYLYNKSLYLLNKEVHYDLGFLLLKEDERIASPTSVIYYEYYTNADEVKHKLTAIKDNIQCIISLANGTAHTVPFGKSQQPALSDYADGVDVMKILMELK